MWNLLLVVSTVLAQSTPQLCAREGEVIASEEYHIAILGNTRPLDVKSDPVAGRVGPSVGITKKLLEDIQNDEPNCVVFVGDMVRNGSKKEWKGFEKNQLSLLGNIPYQPVMGDLESLKDDKYLNTEAVFPDMGTDIGYNRVGSWQYFDIDTGGKVYRMMILDGNKSILKSRWNEQLAWIEETIQGKYDGMFVFIHLPWYNLAGMAPKMNPDEAPEEILTHLEENMDLMKLQGVFFGGGHANQVILPNGNFGVAHIGVGGGGAPAEDLYLYQPGAEHNMTKRIELEKNFKDVLLKEINRWNGQSPLSAATMDKAMNTGTYKGFPGLIEGREFPIQGWWELSLKGNEIRAEYHHYYQNDTVSVIYAMDYINGRGWIGYPR